MTTRSFWVLVGLIGAFAISGLVSLNPALLVLALPLLFYLFVAILNAPGEPDLRARRKMSTDRITQGLEITIDIQVRNHSLPVDELHLSELSSYQFLNLEGQTAKAVQLGQGDTAEYSYSFEGVRGVFHFWGLLARVYEPFGLFEIRKELPARGNLLVYPRVSNLNAIPIRPPETRGFSGPISSRRSGTGMEFFGVRGFQMGDSLRRINWKSSARYPDSLFTNEFEQEQIADVGLILDARSSTDLACKGERLFEHSIQATASLAEMFLTDGHRVSLVVYASHISKVFPGYGKTQFEKILKNLSYIETGMNSALEYFRYLPPRLLPPRGQLVYISPLDYSDLAYLIRLRALGYAVLVLSPNPLDFEIQHLPGSNHPDYLLAQRLAKIERSIQINTLQEAGIPVADWNLAQPLSEVVQNVGIQYTQIQRMVRIQQ